VRDPTGQTINAEVLEKRNNHKIRSFVVVVFIAYSYFGTNTSHSRQNNYDKTTNYFQSEFTSSRF
jgi:hypothetical protein